MSSYLNDDGRECDERPVLRDNEGGTFHPMSDEATRERIWAEQGWRLHGVDETPSEGYRVTKRVVARDGSGRNYWQITGTENIAAAGAAAAADAKAAYLADIATNAKYYALQNAYLMLCGSITGRREKMDGEAMAATVAATISADEKQGETLQRALAFLNDALSYYDTRWWDKVQYRDVPELVAAAQQLLALKE